MLTRLHAVLIALVLAACDAGGTGTGSTATTLAPPPPTTTTSSTTTTVPATTTSTPASTTSTTTPVCEPGEVFGAVDAAIARARLTPGALPGEIPANRFAARTTTGEEFAARLGLDCGALVGQTVGDDDRLIIAAWTGSRLAWVVQTNESPTSPYARRATVTVIIDDTEGEFLDDERTVWAGTFSSGDTFVVGHVDYNLGAAAKGWLAEAIPFDEEPTLASERHAFETLQAAGMRNIGIAEPAELGSEEGHVQFVSPTGQISAADVAPVGWFDPLQPRYLSGPTRVEQTDGFDVRITEPGSADRFALAAEVGFACDDYVWLLQPPFSGDTDELIETARAIITIPECRAG